MGKLCAVKCGSEGCGAAADECVFECFDGGLEEKMNNATCRKHVECSFVNEPKQSCNHIRVFKAPQCFALY